MEVVQSYENKAALVALFDNMFASRYEFVPCHHIILIAFLFLLFQLNPRVSELYLLASFFSAMGHREH